MQAGKRIIINTVVMYAQSVLGILLSLFAARWTLQGLGEVDFGLFGVVGSLILLVTFLSSGLSVGVSRFYAYSIGQGKKQSKEEAVDDLRKWFNIAFSLHLILPMLLIAVGWPVGEYAICHWLTIPDERINACIWVFRFSLVSGFMSIFTVPFVSLFRAYQYMAELSVINVVRSFAVFALAWNILGVTADRLIVYSGWMMAISVAIQMVQVARAYMRFEACRVKLSYLYNPLYLKKLFGYVGWKMFGMSCVVMRQQGSPVLINLFYGPIVNAAYGVSNRLSMQATTLSVAMTQAFQPALIAAEGSGDRQQVLSMSTQVCKFGAMLVLLFSVPLILEMETVLNLWLGNPPQYAVPLCQWLLAMLVVDRVTGGAMLAINAYGKIAVYELVQGSILLSVLPLIWLLYYFDYGASSVGSAMFVSMALYCVGRLLFARFLLGYSLMVWLRKVMLPVALIVIIAVSLGWLVASVMDAGFLRLVLTTFVSFAVILLTAWLAILDQNEKSYLVSALKKKSQGFRV